MKLPNCDRAQVDPAKVTGYLLSITHREGRHKAAFFLSHGFSMASFAMLIDALVRHAGQHEVGEVEEVRFGTKYVINVVMPTPDGRSPVVRSIWIVERADADPRFVTAYPGSRSP